ncbi:C-type lectin domain family 4 member M [Oryzias melastigma]|uniref:C-type lectin domain family 4 member M-like n=1 Tax=Oryzias melastigma TaxID=30732 RepID=A0A3B3CNP3_ORYME|nr:C-type lectin domain family 4 member M [Oryzias melastigma]
MEPRENAFSTYNKLVSQDEIIEDEPPLYPSQEKPQVSLTTVRSNSTVSHYKLLVVSLAVLAVILLVVDIGLGVYYYKLSEGKIGRDIGNEFTKVQGSYNAALQSREAAKEQLEKEIKHQRITKWELDHQLRRTKDYEKQTEKLQLEIATLKSHLPMLKEGCRHCLPGWTFMNSLCYFFPFSDSYSSTTWLDARAFCKRHGGDLAVIDSIEKHLAIMNLINNYQDPSRPIHQSGFWIALRDVDEEGTWRWVDGTRLSEGYWNDGEPNNEYNEDCGAIYPRNNPLKAWNDAPCTYNLKWICEMAPNFQSL